MNIGDKYALATISPVAVGPVMAIKQVAPAITICRFLIRSAPHVNQLISVMAGPALQGKVAVWAAGCQ